MEKNGKEREYVVVGPAAQISKTFKEAEEEAAGYAKKYRDEIYTVARVVAKVNALEPDTHTEIRPDADRDDL